MVAPSPTVVVIDQGSRAPAQAFGLVTRLKAAAPVPIVVLTSLQMPAIEQFARRYGCTCISKPCTPKQVFTSVRSAAAIAGGRAWLQSRNPVEVVSSGLSPKAGREIRNTETDET